MAFYVKKFCQIQLQHTRNEFFVQWARFHFGAGFLASEKKERPSTESLIQWKKLPVPKKKPDDPWSEENALFGENDYKDILGDGTYDLRKNIKSGPWWLKGWKPKNELQMLIAKKRYTGADMGPVEKHELKKRMFYLYKKLNRNKGKWMYRGDD